MKPIFALITAILLVLPELLFAQVINTKHLTEPSLAEGQCHTIADSKVYLKDLKGTNPNKKAVEEIGSDKLNLLSNTEDESYYFCKIKCNLQSSPHYFWLTQKDRNENFKNMNGFVCAGLDIQDVAVSSTLTIKTTVATPFSAVQTQYPEVHAKLRSLSYKITGAPAGTMLVEFFNTLRIMEGAYSLAQGELFQSAAAELKTYAPTNPESWMLIKERVKKLEDQNAQFKPGLAGFKTGEDIVNMFFLTNGMFLRYID